MCITTNNVKTTYLYASVRSEIYVEIPVEDKTEQDISDDNVAMLRLNMYGTRKVSAWQCKIIDVVEQLGSHVCMVNLYICKQMSVVIECMVHGDDFISIGSRQVP